MALLPVYDPRYTALEQRANAILATRQKEWRLLRAHTAGFTSRGVKAIADGPNLDGVTLATFAHNQLGDTGGKHILRWKALEGIRELYLMNMGLSPTMLTRFHKRLGKRVHL